MKNLFKNLMLVAVAAMAFTACQKDNGELDAPKRIVNFTANIGGDDTRSGFTDKGDNGYKSAWDGGETLFVKAENTEKWPTIDAEGKFSVEFSAGDQFATFYSPVASWEYNTSYSTYMPVVPATQTPRANSVDPTAHILQAQNVLISGSENINVTFEHAVAYGKMTVNTPAGFDISKVEINLVGAEYGVEKDLTYTINADNVENNVFWFATEPLNVSEMTVTAYGKEGETDKIYSKTVTVAEGKLEFTYGHVGSFSVSNLVEYEEPAAPAFTSAAYNGNSSDKIVKLYSDQLGELWINFYGSNSLLTNENWINPGTYGKGNGLYFGSYYGQYKPAGYSEFFTATPNSFTLDVSIIDGKYKFVINADYGNGVVLENATFFGEIPGLGIPDYRTKLATPAPSYEKDGMTATVSWERVDGAVGYRVYYTNGGGFDTTTAETSITLEFTQYGEYYVNVIALAADDDPNYKDSDNGYVYLLIEDPRPYLPAPTNVTATIDGANATISWDPVVGADGYQVYYYLNSQVYIDVEGTSTTLELGYDVSNLWVYVFSIANDDNPNYRSSNSWDASVVVNTGKDPNGPIADYMWDESFAWNSAGYFNLTDSTYGSSSYWRIYLNEADRPGNNSIKEGTYIGEYNTTTPSAGHFCVRIGASGVAPFYSLYGSAIDSNCTLEVKIVDNQYRIILTTNGDSHAYIGMPDGFELPTE